MFNPEITVDQVMALGPCREYTRERVVELFGGESTTLLRLIDEVDAPAEDKFWLIGRVLPARLVHRLACQIAERCLEAAEAKGYEIDPRSWEVIRAMRRWLAGEITDEEMAVAKDAAWSAVWAAVRAETEAAWAARVAAEIAGAAWSAAEFARATAAAAAEAAAEAAEVAGITNVTGSAAAVWKRHLAMARELVVNEGKKGAGDE